MLLVAENGNRKRGEKLVDTVLLQEFIDKSGKKKGYLCEKLNLSRQGFRNKELGINDFNSEEINILCTELNITKLMDKERVFFTLKVAKNGNTTG